MPIERVENPFELFARWYDEAKHCKDIHEPTAVTLATADEHGMPGARIILLKGYDERGFTFYTNLHSVKADQLRVNPQASLCFYWMPLNKQVRIRGKVELVSEEEADAYFATRPRESQIGAWASDQSRPLRSREELEGRFAEYEEQFAGQEISRPPHWSGYRVVPETMEFWERRPHRLHDRLAYRYIDGMWESHWLYP